MSIQQQAEAVASFFPSTDEVVRAVQFVRENPAVVLGVVVGITSLSVARYYDEDEDLSEERSPSVAAVSPGEGDALEHTNQPNGQPSLLRVPRNSISCANLTQLSATTSTETFESSESTPAVGVKDHGSKAACDGMHRSCSFCNQSAKTSEVCCDPDWGWFIPTSPEDGHHQRHQHQVHHAHESTPRP